MRIESARRARCGDNARTACGLAGALVALLLLAGCGGGGGAGATDEDGRALATRFLDEIRAGQIDPAWRDSTSPEFKSLMGAESLRDYMKAHPALKGPAEHAESHPVEHPGGPQFEHAFRGTTRIRNKTTPATIKVLVAPGDGGWKVEHLAVE